MKIGHVSEVSKSEFSMAVENHAADKNLPIITSLAIVCIECGLEPSDAGKLLTENIKSKIKHEAIQNRMIKSDEEFHSLEDFFGE